MNFFSRLSDIISCKLDDLLAEAPDASTAITRIIAEIEEGLAGARRSVHSASGAESRLRAELVERQGQVTFWGNKAREELAAGRDDSARQSLFRKRETEDLVAGLQQQLAAATSTREHLSTTLRAIEARLAEAQRRQRDLLTAGSAPTAGPQAGGQRHPAHPPADADRSRDEQIEAELEALRRELGQSK